MDQQQIDQVKATFEYVNMSAFDVDIQSKLTELDTSTLELLSNLTDQSLSSVLSYLVKNLDQLESIAPDIISLGANTSGLSIENYQYGTFAEALDWSLEQSLGNKYTPDVKMSWSKAYSEITGLLKKGASLVAPAEQERISLIESSYLLIEQNKNEIGDATFHKLFEIDPTAKQFLSQDTFASVKFMNAIELIAKNMTQLETVYPKIEQLGNEYLSMGMSELSLNAMAEAFIYALEDILGDSLALEAKQSWIKTLTDMRAIMKKNRLAEAV